MVNTVLLVERRNWFGANQFATRGVHAVVGEIQIDRAQEGFDQIAAGIDFGHDAIGLVGFVSMDYALSHVDRPQCPQRAGAILNDFGIQLLTAEPRALVLGDDRLEKGGCQVGAIVIGRALREVGRFTMRKQLDQLRRLRRRCDYRLRLGAETQTKLRLLPTGFGVPPGGNLVTPELHMLRTTQTLRFLGREKKRDGAVRPDQPAIRLLIDRRFISGAYLHDRRARADALHHDVADVGSRRTDQVHDREFLRPTPDLLGAHASLSKPPTRENEPVHPIASRSKLGRAGPEFPVVQKGNCVAFGKFPDHLAAHCRRKSLEPLSLDSVRMRRGACFSHLSPPACSFPLWLLSTDPTACLLYTSPSPRD